MGRPIELYKCSRCGDTGPYHDFERHCEEDHEAMGLRSLHDLDTDILLRKTKKEISEKEAFRLQNERDEK